MLLLPAIVLLLPAVSLAEPAKWTLHKSCYNSEDLQDAFIKAMITVKSRSKRGAEKLKSSKSKTGGGTKVKEVAQLLLGSKDYKGQADKAIELFEEFGKLDGPIGFGDGFADSDAWKELAKNDNHYLNFVIYCYPDIQKKEVGGIEFDWNVARDKAATNSELLKMKEETDSNKWKNPKKQTLAITEVDSTADGKPNKKARMRIPQTITFHPLWLVDVQKHGYLMKDELRDQICSPNAPDEFKQAGLKPIDSLMLASIEGTLHHELFHLTAFKNLEDEPEGEAYLWDNIARNKAFNPELMAYLAYIIDLLNDGYTVQEGGTLKCKK